MKVLPGSFYGPNKRAQIYILVAAHLTRDLFIGVKFATEHVELNYIFT